VGLQVGSGKTLKVTGTCNLDTAVTINDSGADVDFRVEGDTDANLLFVDASTDRVGVGIATPAEKLHLFGSSSATSPKILVQSHDTASATAGITFYGRDASNVNFISGLATSGSALTFLTNNTLQATLDASGNLGLGVTPSATDSTYYQAFEISKAGQGISAPNSALTSVGRTWVTNNSYATYSAGVVWKYATSSAAALYEIDDQTHKWYTAPSGTAGNNITFTQAMTLDASGNLLVGATTNPGVLNKSFVINSGSGAFAGVVIQSDATGTGSADGSALFINSNADLNLYNFENKPLLFGTNNAERARITSGGSWFVGTTAQPSSSQIGFAVQPNSTVGYYIGNAVNVTTAAAHMEFYNPNGTVGSITTANSATAYNTSSDVRLKKNIVDAEDSGSDVDALKVRAFDWKADDFHVKYGFIAQELVNVAPEAVKVGDDGDEVTDTWGVDYSKLVPILVKEIQSLRARVAALEGAN
jgi:hypothetical protein